MLRKNAQRLAAALLCVLALLLLSFPAGADFGDYSGNSDYGSSSDWSSSDSDWGSSDYSWDSDYESSGGDAEPLSFGGIVGFLAIALVMILIFNIGGKRRKKKNPGSWSAAASRKLTPMAEYAKLDENFDADELTAKLSNLYVQMQDCWQAKDISPIRPYCTEVLYAQMERQLEKKKQKGLTNYVERVAVLGLELRGFCQENGNDVIVARLRSRIVDYTLEDATGNLVSGDRNREKFMTYEWDLVRPTGGKTAAGEEMKSVNCPNCGAPVEINASAKCPYCGSVITLEEHGFALNAIRAIAQSSAP